MQLQAYKSEGGVAVGVGVYEVGGVEEGVGVGGMCAFDMSIQQTHW